LKTELREQTEKQVISVTELTKYIKLLFDVDMVLSDIWVRGEISNFKKYDKGQAYFTLKDEGSQISCVIFGNFLNNLKFMPEEGMKAIVRGKVSVFEKRGQYQFQVNYLEPEGVGALSLALEQLKQKLADEGLFDTARKRPIPYFPRTVGVITSSQAAALRDIMAVVSRRNPLVQLVLISALVQGEAAPQSLVRAIKKANQHRDLEVLILARGGGSREELWAFNDENVARQIFHSRIPVISAVGHETDFTIADMVADVRAPTPSVAAEIVAPLRDEMVMRVEQLSSELKQALSGQVKRQKEKITWLSGSLGQIIKAVWQKRRSAWQEQVAKLEALSPLAVLDRGYSITRTEMGGKVIRDQAEVKISDMVEIVLAKGKLKGKVLEKHA
jgi:exodeoxyribonuclease VII large subunit